MSKNSGLSKNASKVLSEINWNVDTTNALNFNDLLIKLDRKSGIKEGEVGYFNYDEEVRDILQYLLDNKKININYCDKHGNSLLMILEAHQSGIEDAHMYGSTHEDSMTFLMERGIDPLIETKDGDTILEFRFHWFDIKQHSKKTAAEIYKELEGGFDVDVDDRVARYYLQSYGQKRHQGNVALPIKEKKELGLDKKPEAKKFANDITTALRNEDSDFKSPLIGSAKKKIENIRFDDKGCLHIICNNEAAAQSISKQAKGASIQGKEVILGTTRQWQFYNKFVYPKVHPNEKLTGSQSKGLFAELKREQYLLENGKSVGQESKRDTKKKPSTPSKSEHNSNSSSSSSRSTSSSTSQTPAPTGGFSVEKSTITGIRKNNYGDISIQFSSQKAAQEFFNKNIVKSQFHPKDNQVVFNQEENRIVYKKQHIEPMLKHLEPLYKNITLEFRKVENNTQLSSVPSNSIKKG